MYGSGTASVVLEDLEKADLAIVAGANPASNHPRLITQIVNIRWRGGKVIVVNPPGGTHSVVRRAARADSIRHRDARGCPARYFCWAMGLTHHVHGVDNILALSNVALTRGWLGRPGCGLLHIRGHSNVQGVGSVGVNPTLKAAFAERMQELYGIEAGGGDCLDTYASMRAAREGNMDAAFLMGGNLYGSSPDLPWASEALEKIPFSVYVSTRFNQGHVHGRGKTTIVLPPLARDEETQTTTQESMFNFVRLSDRGAEPPSSELRSEVDIRPGNLAMYYPEANRLVPRRLDPASGTPAFKSVPARLNR